MVVRLIDLPMSICEFKKSESLRVFLIMSKYKHINIPFQYAIIGIKNLSSDGKHCLVLFVEPCKHGSLSGFAICPQPSCKRK